MVSTRCKFFVVGKKEHEHAVEVNLSAVYSPDANDENRKFWNATPNGQVRLWIENKPAAEVFEEGKKYYLDFTPAPD